jgi:hypothetical protein
LASAAVETLEEHCRFIAFQSSLLCSFTSSTGFFLDLLLLLDKIWVSNPSSFLAPFLSFFGFYNKSFGSNNERKK